MIINNINNRNVLLNIRRIYKNYKLLKLLSKTALNIKIINNFYWSYILDNFSPSLSDVCKHIIYTKFCYVHTEKNYYIKYGLFPTKLHIKEFQIYNNIIRREFNKEKVIQYDDLFVKYHVDKVFANVDIFKSCFEEFYEYYCNSKHLIEILNEDSIFKSLEEYTKL